MTSDPGEQFGRKLAQATWEEVHYLRPDDTITHGGKASSRLTLAYGTAYVTVERSAVGEPSPDTVRDSG